MENVIRGNEKTPGPVKRRYIVLDMLRGFAILGIILANFPEFSLWTFQPESVVNAMPSADTDRLTQWLLYIFVDGKFYTIFSLLFGIGFSIISSNCQKRGANGTIIFYRRMTVLALIGAAHLLLLWSGDILLLYAIMGMLLPLFWRCSDRGLLRWALFFLVLPVFIDFIRSVTGFSLADYPYNAWWDKCDEYGITEENFGVWLHDAKSYKGVHSFLMQGAIERMWEFVAGNRYFKVLGLFLLGLYIGRNKLYADIERYKPLLRRVLTIGACVGLPLSTVYAWSSMNGHPGGNVIHSVLYCVSVYPLGLAYGAGLSLLFHRMSHLKVWKILALPGRMALTNYLLQSVAGIIIFYGIGLGLGSEVSLATTECIAIAVYVVEIVFSAFWLNYFQFGPTEWVWRMLTYGRWFNILKQKTETI